MGRCIILRNVFVASRVTAIGRRFAMKRHLQFLVLFLLWLVPVCGTVARAESNDDMFAAVKSRNAPEVRRLLAAGADVNGRDDRGATPLVWAAVTGSREIAELLIARGADVNAKDRSGFTPLHVAAYQSRREVAELLIAKGAEVNARSTAGWTPLHKAMERLANPEVMHQASPSDVAAMVSVVELLLANGADLNAKSTFNMTPLHFAAASGQKVLVEFLLAKGADINVKGNEDVTPLYMAVKMDRAEVAELLIARGAEVNARTKSGYTPLIWAANTGNKDIVNLLIARGADVNVKDINGKTPLVWALGTAMFVSPTGQAIYSRYLSQLSPAEQAQFRNEIKRAKGQWREVAKLLIDHGADINVDVSGGSPLFAAANLGDKDLVAVLIDHGADMNDAKPGETALHAAIARRDRNVAELLIQKGANVNVRNMSGRTPLHFLAHYIHDWKLAELMIEHGAQIDATDKNGETPLAFATRAGNFPVSEVLRQHAATTPSEKALKAAESPSPEKGGGVAKDEAEAKARLADASNPVVMDSTSILESVVKGRLVDKNLHAEFWQAANPDKDPKKVTDILKFIRIVGVYPFEHDRLLFLSAKESFRQRRVVRLEALEDLYREWELALDDVGLDKRRINAVKQKATDMLEGAAAGRPLKRPDGTSQEIDEAGLSFLAQLHGHRATAVKKLMNPDWQDEVQATKAYDELKIRMPAQYLFADYAKTFPPMCGPTTTPTTAKMMMAVVDDGGLMVMYLPQLQNCPELASLTRQETVNLMLYGVARGLELTITIPRTTESWRQNTASKICGVQTPGLFVCVMAVLVESNKRLYMFVGMAKTSLQRATQALNIVADNIQLID